MRLSVAAVALVAMMIPASVLAQPPAIQTAPLSVDDLPALSLYELPGSNFSAGWDGIKAVQISTTNLLRFFYRKADGLLVGVMEDSYGAVVGQTPAWIIGRDLDQFDVTLMSRPATAATSLLIFGYNRASGKATRRLIWWPSASQQ